MIPSRNEISIQCLANLIRLVSQTEKEEKRKVYEEKHPPFPFHFAHEKTEKGLNFLNLPETLDIKWLTEPQTPGMICLGRV